MKKSKETQTRNARRSAELSGSFRRNNLVISRSQREMVERQRSVTQRQFEKKASLKKRRRRLRLLVCLGILLLAALFVRMMPSKPHLEFDAKYEVPEEKQQNYRQELADLMANNTVLRQSWLVDVGKVKQEFMTTFTEVETLEIKNGNPFNTSPKIMLSFRKPVFSWLDTSKQTQFVDSHGMLFVNNYDSSVDTGKLVKIEDESGAVLSPGDSVLTDRLISFIGTIPAKISPLYNKAPIARVIVPVSTREVQVQVAKQPYIIRFSTERGIEEQSGELSTLLKFLNSRRITPSSYIDLRVVHKAFYK